MATALGLRVGAEKTGGGKLRSGSTALQIRCMSFSVRLGSTLSVGEDKPSAVPDFSKSSVFKEKVSVGYLKPQLEPFQNRALACEVHCILLVSRLLIFFSLFSLEGSRQAGSVATNT